MSLFLEFRRRTHWHWWLLTLLALLMAGCGAPAGWMELEAQRHPDFEAQSQQSLLVLVPASEVAAYRREFPQAVVQSGHLPLTNAALAGRALLLIGNPENNSAWGRLISSLPIEIAVDRICGREIHTGDDLTVLLRWRDPCDAARAVCILGGTSPEALRRDARDLELDGFDYRIRRNGEVVESGYFHPVASPSAAETSMWLFSEMTVVTPGTGASQTELRRFAAEFLPPVNALLAVNACPEATERAQGSRLSRPVISDREAMNGQINAGSVLALGAPEENGYLSKWLERLPFEVVPGRITGRRAHSGENLLLYARVPAEWTGTQAVRLLTSGKSGALVHNTLVDFFTFRFNRADYMIFDGAAGRVLEMGSYPFHEPEFTLGATPRSALALMKEDWDYLSRFLRSAMGAAAAGELEFETGIAEAIDKRRARLTGEESPAEFCALTQEALMAAKGDHLNVAMLRCDHPPFLDCSEGGSWLYQTGSEPYMEIHGAPAADTDAQYMTYINHLWRHQGNYGNGPELLYWHGDYYSGSDFTYDGVSYPRGMRLVAVNDVPIRECLAGIQELLFAWDSRERVFYDEKFYEKLPLPADATLRFRFEDADGAAMTLPYRVGGNCIGANTLPKREWAVEYFPEARLLYLSLPVMSDEVDLLPRLREVAAGREIAAVVLDIRRNPGGSDLVWMKLLSMLTDREFRYTFLGAVPNTPEGRSYLPLGQRQRIDWLGHQEFITQPISFAVGPAGNSLRLSAPIYVLTENIYSAAGKLSVFARGTERITTVGTENPNAIGAPGHPEMLYLPNSRQLIRFRFLSNFADSQNALDTMHRKPEVELDLSLEEALAYRNIDPVLPLRDRLFEHDPYFRKVLSLIGALPGRF